MRWTDRQLAMLEAMGLRLWLPRSPLPPAGTAGPALTARRAAAEDNDAATPTVSAPSTSPRLRAIPALAGVVADTSPVPDGVGTMDWAALRRAVAGCTACKLCERRRQTVFGVGHERARWMIVGEAPGEQEDLQGEPFVGKSGQLLDNMLRAIGLSRSADVQGASDAPRDGHGHGDGDPARQVYICNTVKCRPPGNRNPQPEELARCEAYLVRQIELVQPRIILAMGRFAVQSLLRSDEPIGRLRGRVHRYQGVPLIVTFHPAYLLRNCEDKAKAWDDLCLALETVQRQPGPDAAAPEPAAAGAPVSA